MEFIKRDLPGVIELQPQVFGDQRGFFMELYHRDKFAVAGITEDFVQDNLSSSQQGVIRGLHYQLEHAQGKLVTVFSGEVFDVAVDIRRGSPTFGKWTHALLSAEKRNAFYVPPGFAHGFCVISDFAEFFYKCTDIYFPRGEREILWNDPAIGIDWPVKDPVLSEKDQIAPLLKDAELPEYTA